MARPTARSSLIPWLVVGFGFLALALAYSARATLGLVMPALEQDMARVISGGDAESLLGLLDDEFQYIPDLVMHGLAVIVEASE